MDEELYRLISTGLLALIVLLLLFVIAKLGKLQRATPASDAAADRTAETPSPESPEAVALPVSTPDPEPAAEPEPTSSDEEGPFERDGRWWFRRDGELLVYDEQAEEWVDPTALAEPAQQPASVTPEVTEPAPVPAADTGPRVEDVKPHPLEEARGWDTAPVTTAAPETTTPAEVPATTTPAEATQAPIPEPVSPPGSITEVEPAVTPPPADPSDQASGGHWKCPACGVINGSTATSCRMCFAARP